MNKTSKQLERYLKGAANHRRIDILMLVAKHDNLSVEDIAEKFDANLKTISMHTLRLVQAGLLNKKYQGRTVVHSLSPYGKNVHAFLTTF